MFYHASFFLAERSQENAKKKKEQMCFCYSILVYV